MTVHLQLLYPTTISSKSNLVELLFGLNVFWLNQHFVSLGPVVNILAIFSNANILKNKRIKIYQIKGIGCPLLISINIDAWGHPWYFPLIIR